jgi:hypothetical protein
MFQNVLRSLQHYQAIDQENKPTEFGKKIASYSGDNELWVATVLSHQNISSFNEAVIIDLLFDSIHHLFYIF